MSKPNAGSSVLLHITTALILLNPISLFFISTILISLYVILLLGVTVYATLRTIKEYFLSEFGQYFDTESLVFINSVKLPTMNAQVRPLDSKLEKIILFGPLMVYLATRICVHSYLSMIHFVILKIISLGPFFRSVGNAVFRFIVAQIRWVRLSIRLFSKYILDPISQVLTPVVEKIIEYTLKFWIETYRLVNQHGPYIYNTTKELIYKYSGMFWNFWIKAANYSLALYNKLYDEQIVPLYEQSKQIALKLWPILKSFIYSVILVLEKFDRTYRPLLMPYLLFFIDKCRVLVELTFYGLKFTIESYWTIFTFPITVSSFFIRQITHQLSLLFKQIKWLLEPIGFKLLEIWGIVKPILINQLFALKVFIVDGFKKVQQLYVDYNIDQYLARLFETYKYYLAVIITQLDSFAKYFGQEFSKWLAYLGYLSQRLTAQLYDGISVFNAYFDALINSLRVMVAQMQARFRK
ncbi:hypothetical protein HK103_007219 [Boothiomyces macroporosus]|uniref:Uncharacterized protein n=1 Tax=Boothiomyces macroporosus TaxID=261099 RepID=A0AAD5UCR8_9FUNG|nr:hypothetical protein HK103_007219 [Boothiomyces macroporosus]